MHKKLPKSVTVIFTIAAIVLVGVLTTMSVELLSSQNSTTAFNIQSPSVPSIATVSALSITHSANSAAVGSANTLTISWKTSNYPSAVGVNINLLKMTSSSPVSYSLVRQLGVNVPNNGSFTWTVVPSTDTGTNLYAEVTCANTTVKTTSHAIACQVTSQPIAVN